MDRNQFRLNLRIQWLPLLTAYFFSLIPALLLFLIAMACFRVNERFGPHGGSGVLWLVFDSILSACVVAATFRIRRTLSAILETEQRYRIAIECAPDGILISDKGGLLLEANAAACALVGCSRADLRDVSLRDLAARHKCRTLLEAFRATLAGAMVTRECPFGRTDGTEWIAEATGSVLHDGRVMLILRDVSRRRRAEAQLRASLAEKDVLLKEVHHRVKNNLQIVTSLLSLQSQRITDPELLTAFRETENRVRSIALLHEELYRSADLARIDFPRYLQAVGGRLASAYSFPAFRIRLAVKATALTLDLATAVPCALIVNELVSNAMRHAFPDGQGGEIYPNAAGELLAGGGAGERLPQGCGRGAAAVAPGAEGRAGRRSGPSAARR
jgi:PAS domain S-box-containing protein